MKKSKIQIIGAGAFGTGFANFAAKSGFEVSIFSRKEEIINEINISNRSQKLPNIKLEPKLKATSKIDNNLDYIFLATPSENLIEAFENAQSFLENKTKIVILTKGMNHKNQGLFSEYFSDRKISPIFFSGPNFADEIARCYPFSASAGCENLNILSEFTRDFSSENLAIYPTSDVISVQLSGVYKNILAIYCGYISEQGYGLNYHAKICVDGINELKYISKKLGGSESTIDSYCGVGDIFLSCFSSKSRNYNFGRNLFHKNPSDKIIINSCTEGINSTISMNKLCNNFIDDSFITKKLEKIFKDKIGDTV